MLERKQENDRVVRANSLTTHQKAIKKGLKNMSIRKMQDEVIRKEGFESKKTIRFFKVCESNNRERIEKEFKKIVK